MRRDLIEIIREAGKIAKAAYYSESKITVKAPKDLATDADKEIEINILRFKESASPFITFFKSLRCCYGQS
jgi:fructose-1,6-bisphosphatase/inositol monophosphatase family enzyme